MRDLAELMDPELVLPIGGREFRVSCSARQGLHLVQLLNEKPRLSDEQERDEIVFALGDTYEQMTEAGVSWPKIAVAGRVVMAHYGLSPEAGRMVWESAGGVLAGNPLPPPPEPIESGGDPSPQDLSAPGTYGPDDPGGGPYDEVTGVRDWYNPTPGKPRVRRNR